MYVTIFSCEARHRFFDLACQSRAEQATTDSTVSSAILFLASVAKVLNPMHWRYVLPTAIPTIVGRCFTVSESHLNATTWVRADLMPYSRYWVDERAVSGSSWPRASNHYGIESAAHAVLG